MDVTTREQYWPETYVSPCRTSPAAFDYVIQHRRAAEAIRICKRLCAGCHLQHQATCLAENRDTPGVVAGLTLDERRALGLTGRRKARKTA